MSGSHQKKRRSPAARGLGLVASVILMLAGVACLAGAAYMHFGVIANFNEHSRPDHVYDSAGDDLMELTAPYGSYGITSVRAPLQDCTVASTDGAAVEVYRDEEITKRPAFRFDAPAGTYEVSCTPEAYFEVFDGADLLVAARGYGGGLHPSLYFLAGAAVLLPSASFLWNRFVQRPRDWAYTAAE